MRKYIILVTLNIENYSVQIFEQLNIDDRDGDYINGGGGGRSVHHPKGVPYSVTQFYQLSLMEYHG
jgi:hypothetical protein